MSNATHELTDVDSAEHANFFTTTADALANWARKSSLWPYPSARPVARSSSWQLRLRTTT